MQLLPRNRRKQEFIKKIDYSKLGQSQLQLISFLKILMGPEKKSLGKKIILD